MTLVGEDDWAGAIAAAVLMAAPVRAPLLFSGADELPDPTAEALAALDPQGEQRDRRRDRSSRSATSRRRTAAR